MKRLFFLFGFTLFCGFGAQSQHFLKAEGSAIVNEAGENILLRGVGLGGWMVQEGYMLQTASFASPQHEIKETITDLIGEEATDAFYDAWLHNHCREADIDSMKAWGFNSVRLPMHYNLFTLPIEEEPVPFENTWLDLGFELTDSLVQWCKEREMYVILDLHAAPGGQGYDAAISDYDSSKPSLWESIENRHKMASLWKRIAEHYVDEPWVAGYDLLNEPNWDLPGGNALRALYMQCTDSIRLVDQDHMIFIEGNWFANDFTGLTPPWDDNLVYSPHKYWSHNEEVDMQFATSIRTAYDVPLYLGESGENSNVWFRDAIHLLEDLNIGWAWWPLKKIESISGSMSIEKTEGYQSLLNYWEGNGPTPTAEYATEVLMDLTEKLKAENCLVQRDVIDAMLRQPHSDATAPYHGPHNVPGVVHATDYDMGRVGIAYHDVQVANYHVTTGNFTAWNNGWAYRNDGVDIEPSTDNVNSNGYSVGWTTEGEWLKYTVEVETSGLYDINMRYASLSGVGQFHFDVNGLAVNASSPVPSTGAWNSWGEVGVEGVLLYEGTNTLTIHVDESGFNFSSFEFQFTGITPDEVSPSYVIGQTIDSDHISLLFNKPLDASTLGSSPSGFTFFAEGQEVAIAAVEMNPASAQSVILTLESEVEATMDLNVSYSNGGLAASDGVAVDNFEMAQVDNTLDYWYPLPGWLEAEDYTQQTGVELETTSDAGGGQNVGFLDPGDVMEYNVNVTKSGEYSVNFRTASEYGNGGLALQLIAEDGSATLLCQPTFEPTGGWQTWTTTSDEIAHMDKGLYTLRVTVTSSPFNLNWFEFKFEGTEDEDDEDDEDDDAFDFPLQTVVTYPNPTADEVNVAFSLFFRQNLSLSVHDMRGNVVHEEVIEDVSQFVRTLQVEGWASGLYQVSITREDGTVDRGRFIKVSN